MSETRRAERYKVETLANARSSIGNRSGGRRRRHQSHRFANAEVAKHRHRRSRANRPASGRAAIIEARQSNREASA